MTVFGLSFPVEQGAKAIPMRCEQCGDEVQIVAPVKIDTIVVISQAFEAAHKKCERSKP